MNNDILRSAEKYFDRKKHNKIWNKLAKVLGCIVLFCTTYALILPAVTMEYNVFCGMDEHKHSEECYTRYRDMTALTCSHDGIVLHTHDDMCYHNGELICCLSEVLPHTHDSSCYSEAHEHTDECYSTSRGELLCALTEEAIHVHTELCYTEQSQLVCTLEDPDHIHDENCYQVTDVLTCGIDDMEVHVHTDQCYAVEKTLVCTLPTEPQLICGKDEVIPHIHDEDCFEDGALVCVLDEVYFHSHDESCLELHTMDVHFVCQPDENAAHTHSPLCYANGILICPLEEKEGHTHDESCYEDGLLVCQTEETVEHIHDASCLMISSQPAQLVCQPEENTVHVHSGFCYQNGILICPLEELEAHTHDESCYEGDTLICDKDEVIVHSHNEDCFDEEGIFICTLPEIGEHSHSAQCFDITRPYDDDMLTCGREEDQLHSHCALCYGTWVLDCDRQEHTHNELCFIDTDAPANAPSFTLSGIAADQEMLTLSQSETAQQSGSHLMEYINGNGGTFALSLSAGDHSALESDENGIYTVSANTQYILTLSALSPNGIAQGSYTYQLAEGVTAVSGKGNLTIDDALVGTYEVDESGLVTLAFDENTGNYSQVSITADIFILFDGTHQDVSFDDMLSVYVLMPLTSENNVAIEKSGSVSENILSWNVGISAGENASVAGYTLTDSLTTDNHRYTEADISNGIALTARYTDENGNAVSHSHLITSDKLEWNESGWAYTLPESLVCDQCGGELAFSQQNCLYTFEYTSTADLTVGGNYAKNTVSLDDLTAQASVALTDLPAADVTKTVSFSDGSFVWNTSVTIPVSAEITTWTLSDSLYIADKDGNIKQELESDIGTASVTAIVGETTTNVPLLADADQDDIFAIEADGSGNITFCNRCFCEETCSCYGSSLCSCWNNADAVTFIFEHSTDAHDMIGSYGNMGYVLTGSAALTSLSGENVSGSAQADIPDLFTKELTKAFDGYTASYSITVNDAMLDIADGEPVVVTDIMSDTLSYVSGSLVVTAEGSDGGISTLIEGADYTVLYDGADTHTLTVTIANPSSCRYTLSYDATLIFPDEVSEEGITYSNSAASTLMGVEYTSQTGPHCYTGKNLAAMQFAVRITKLDSSDNYPLADAEFAIFNENGSKLVSGVTDINGQLVMGTDLASGVVLQPHTPYYVRETRAPAHYELTDNEFWFTFCTCEGECAEAPSVYGKTVTAVGTNEDGQYIYDITATNTPSSYMLPKTGGMGREKYIFIGGVMFITASVALITDGIIRKRTQGF